MKELSIEEKARRYDEVIESGKLLLSGNQLGDAWIYKLLPELAESEDERIRKELIEQVVYIIPNDDEVDSEGNILPTYQKRIDKYIAWLEKQGEQHTLQTDDVKLEDNSAPLSTGAIGFDGKPMESKPCEQNPAEWSEEDERNINAIRTCIYYNCNAEDASNAITWLISLKERVLPQPKQEWSEEDENRFNNLIFLVECSDENEPTKKGFIDFINRLKSLKDRVQPRQDLGEEDEKNNNSNKSDKVKIIIIKED